MADRSPLPKRAKRSSRKTVLREPYNLRSKPMPALDSAQQMMAAGRDKKRKQATAAPPTGPIQIMDLNRDCLLHIFSFLNVADLHTCANVSKQFRVLAKDEFDHKYKYFDFSSLIDAETTTMARYGKAKCVMFKFGDSIKRMNFSGYIFHGRSEEQTNMLLLDVGKYCGNGTLSELILDDIYLKFDIVPLMEKLFQSIQKLEINSSRLKKFNNANFPQLKVLKLINLDFGLRHIPECLPRLEELHLDAVRNIRSSDLATIILKSPHLKVLSIKSCGPFTAFVMNGIRSLAASDGHIEHFEMLDRIRTTQEALKILGGIKSLKILKFNCNGGSTFDLLADLVKNDVKIEHLHIAHGILNEEAAKMFAQMDKISCLELNDIKTENNNGLGAMLEHLPPCLQELHIKTDRPFNIQKLKVLLSKLVNLSTIRIDSPDLFISLNAYNEFIEILKKRPEMINLKFVIYGNGLAVPKNVFDANKFWLEIKSEKRGQKPMFPRILYDDTDDEDDEDDDFDNFEDFNDEDDDFFNDDFESDSDEDDIDPIDFEMHPVQLFGFVYNESDNNDDSD